MSTLFKEVLHIFQTSSITRTSPLDYLVLNPGHSLRKSYSSAEVQSMCLQSLLTGNSQSWM